MKHARRTLLLSATEIDRQMNLPSFAAMPPGRACVSRPPNSNNTPKRHPNPTKFTNLSQKYPTERQQTPQKTINPPEELSTFVASHLSTKRDPKPVLLGWQRSPRTCIVDCLPPRNNIFKYSFLNCYITNLTIQIVSTIYETTHCDVFSVDDVHLVLSHRTLYTSFHHCTHFWDEVDYKSDRAGVKLRL